MSDLCYYQLFTDDIKNSQHKKFLMRLVSTYEGRKEFSKLLLELLMRYIEKQEIDLSGIIITCSSEAIILRISGSRQLVNLNNNINIPGIEESFFNHCYQNFLAKFISPHILNKVLQVPRYDSQAWMNMMKQIWFKKNTMIKVKYHIGKKSNQQLLLLPNQDIIKTTMNKNQNIILDVNSTTYYNSCTQNMVSFQELLDCSRNDLCYRGQLHPVYFIPQGKGIFLPKVYHSQKILQFSCDLFNLGLPQQQFHAKRVSGNSSIEQTGKIYNGLLNGDCELSMNGRLQSQGTYSGGQKSGIFKEQKEEKYYHNGTLVDYRPPTSTYLPDKSILSTKEFNITINLFKNLEPGKWLNQQIVDFYIQQFYLEYQLSLPKKDKFITSCKPFRSIIIDTRETADLFSSQITQQNYINTQYWKEVTEKKGIQLNQPNQRIVFLFNVDRSHFMSAVYEQQTIYIINSLNSLSDEIIYSKLKQLLTPDWSVLKGEQINVPQQPNGYDCGIYTLYYAILILKSGDKSVKEINFTVNYNQISEFRLQITQELLQQNPSILVINPQFKGRYCPKQ